MTLLDNLPHTGTHYRKRYEQDEYIATRTVYVEQATGIPCWVQNASMSEIEEFDKTDQRVTHKVYFATDPSMRPGDRFVITDGPSFVGKQLNFMAHSDASAGLGVVQKIMFDEERNVPAGFSD